MKNKTGFLQIETFDPHEPFYVQQNFLDLYEENYEGPLFDWPKYDKVTESDEQSNHLRNQYYALLSMCDKYLGKVLDKMDDYNMWDDTMLIVNTDHGFLLGEHGWWAKCVQPFYNEVAHTPLFIWDPRTGIRNEKRKSLVQTIDLAPTILDFLDIEIPEDMMGKSLKETICNDKQIRNAALFGLHGGQINVTDGRYVYMRSPVNADNKPLYQHTLMPTRHGAGRAFIDLDEMRTAVLSRSFSFTKNCSLLKIESKTSVTAKSQINSGTMLFDLFNDPNQLTPINDTDIEKMMIGHMKELMRQNDCPDEQYIRIGI
jgi:hypothetical protein